MENFDFIAIGDITTDAFIHLKEPSAHCRLDHNNLELCVNFGDKIPYDFVEVVRAVGNSPNAAVSAARLGLKSALVSNLGQDQNGRECTETLKKENVSAQFIIQHDGAETNYHYVLWFESDRTILVKHHEYPRQFPDIGNPKWIYLSSIGQNTEKYHEEIADYLEKNQDVKLCFQPGTFQIKMGIDQLKKIYKNSELVAVNKFEAKEILKTESEKIKELLDGFVRLGVKTVLITDGPKGAYYLDSRSGELLFSPPFPDPKPPYDRTGAGDAYTSTFVAMLGAGKTPEEALRYAGVNSMSVVQYVGAQKGLLTQEQIEKHLTEASDNYLPKKLSTD